MRKSGSGKKASPQKIRSHFMRDWIGGHFPLDLNRNVSDASTFIEDILESVGMRGGLDEDRVKEAWKSLAGDAIASQTEPVSLRKGCLTLKVLQPAMRFHLEQLKPQLLRKLQSELGEENITKLRMTLG
jgi:predicted nucleic acid-binding Zn ribbon protein